MPSIFADQQLLILVTPPDSNLIAEKGEIAESEGTEAFHLSNSRGKGSFSEIPTAAGFHVWKGEIECTPSDPGLGGTLAWHTSTWRGEWSPATTSDLAAFGVMIPSPDEEPHPCHDSECPCLHPEVLPPDVINGCHPIHQFFGLSYANYLVLPRTLLQSMPQSWQARFVTMLSEMRQQFGDFPSDGEYQVNLKDDRGRFISDPLSDYERGRRIIPAKTD